VIVFSISEGKNPHALESMGIAHEMKKTSPCFFGTTRSVVLHSLDIDRNDDTDSKQSCN
jgi:hypothetical protein